MCRGGGGGGGDGGGVSKEIALFSHFLDFPSKFS